jgi:hypothetical protein
LIAGVSKVFPSPVAPKLRTLWTAAPEAPAGTGLDPGDKGCATDEAEPIPATKAAVRKSFRVIPLETTFPP